MSVEKSLADMASEYERAKSNYDDAERAVSNARSHETKCLNKLNAAQKAWDAHVEKLRKEAPRASDWKQSDRRRETASV